MLRPLRILTAALLLLPALSWATPDVVLKDFSGAARNVNEFIGKGKWVVVTVWAHNCPVCNAEIYQMTFFHDEHAKKDAIVLGVTIDGEAGRDKAKDFLKRHDLNFTNLIAEPEQEVLAAFGGGPFIGTPTFYIYSPQGKLVAQRIGPTTQEQIEEIMGSHAGKAK